LKGIPTDCCTKYVSLARLGGRGGRKTVAHSRGLEILKGELLTAEHWGAYGSPLIYPAAVGIDEL
jgi:hypothetical protein